MTPPFNLSETVLRAGQEYHLRLSMQIDPPGTISEQFRQRGRTLDNLLLFEVWTPDVNELRGPASAEGAPMACCKKLYDAFLSATTQDDRHRASLALQRHCRTAEHVANRHGVDKKLVVAAAALFEAQDGNRA